MIHLWFWFICAFFLDWSWVYWAIASQVPGVPWRPSRTVLRPGWCSVSSWCSSLRSVRSPGSLASAFWKGCPSGWSYCCRSGRRKPHLPVARFWQVFNVVLVGSFCFSPINFEILFVVIVMYGKIILLLLLRVLVRNLYILWGFIVHLVSCLFNFIFCLFRFLSLVFLCCFLLLFFILVLISSLILNILIKF